jgi:hypothetical protein
MFISFVLAFLPPEMYPTDKLEHINKNFFENAHRNIVEIKEKKKNTPSMLTNRSSGTSVLIHQWTIPNCEK